MGWDGLEYIFHKAQRPLGTVISFGEYFCETVGLEVFVMGW